MLGRGILRNPGLIDTLSEKQTGTLEERKKTLQAFHDRLYRDYQAELSGDRNVLYKMKELWFYLIHSFSNEDTNLKKIKRAERLSDYETIVKHIFYAEDYYG